MLFLNHKLFQKKLILFILFLALLTRILGINYGLPYFFVGDERSLIAGALKMAELKTLIPAFHPQEFKLLYYPPLMSYIYLAFLGPIIGLKYLTGSFVNFQDFKTYLVLNPGFIWFFGRLLNVLIGIGTIYLIYLIGKKVFNEWTGLLAATFLTFSFLHIQLSHFTRHWVPTLFFTYLVIFFAFSFCKQPHKKYYFLAGLFSGLAFGISYVTALSWIVILLAHFLCRDSSFFDKLKCKNLWIGFVIFLILSLVFILLYPQEFLRMTIGEDTGLTTNKSLINYLLSFIYYFKILVFYEPIILLFSLFGFLLLIFHQKRHLIIFLAFSLLYITVLYLFFHNEPRYIILIVPWLCILAGYSVYILISQITKRNLSSLLIFLVLFLIFCYPIAVSIKYGELLTQKDTRILAKEWIEKNIHPESKIVTDWAGIKLIPDKKSILLQRKLDENSLRVADRVLLNLDNSKYPQVKFSVLRLHFIGEKLPKDLFPYIKDNNYQYFVVDYWQKKELTSQDKSIIKKGHLIKKFTTGVGNISYDINNNFIKPISIIFHLKRLGPIVEIYKL